MMDPLVAEALAVGGLVFTVCGAATLAYVYGKPLLFIFLLAVIAYLASFVAPF